MTETRDKIQSIVRGILDRFRKHLRITGNDLDAELTQDLLAAIASAEHITGLVIISSTFTRTDTFSSELTLRGPRLSVSSVVVDGETISEDYYSVSGRVLTIDDDIDGDEVVVTYTAGFEPIPDDIIAAVLLHATSLFSNPLDSVETLPKASSNLLRPYRTWGIDS